MAFTATTKWRSTTATPARQGGGPVRKKRYFSSLPEKPADDGSSSDGWHDDEEDANESFRSFAGEISSSFSSSSSSNSSRGEAVQSQLCNATTAYETEHEDWRQQDGSEKDMVIKARQDKVISKYLGMAQEHACSKSFIQKSWQFMVNMWSQDYDDFHSATAPMPTSLATLHKRASQHNPLPTVLADIVVYDNESHELEKWNNLAALPMKVLRKKRFELVSSVHKIKMADLIKLHRWRHNQHLSDELTVDISVDSILESDTGGRSLTLCCLRFVGCDTVYACRTYKPVKHGTLFSAATLMDDWLEDILECGLQVRFLIADAPMRAKLKCVKSHSGFSSCDICEARGETGLSRKVYFPSSTIGAPRRTGRTMRALAMNSGSGARDVGIIGNSPLFKLPHFDIVKQVPLDYMHSCCLGMVRKTFLLIFGLVSGSGRGSRLTREFLEEVSLKMRAARVPSEFSRRVRPIKEYSQYTASEWRNLALCFFPLVLPHIIVRKEQKLFAKICFALRAFVLPDVLTADLGDDFNALLESIYRNFEQCFGSAYCSYNVHVFHHIGVLRGHGPLTETSAFRFELFYSSFKKRFAVGTPATGKQAMEALLRRVVSRSSHKCQRELKYKLKVTEARNDTLIYTESGKVCQISNIATLEKDTFDCREIYVVDYTCCRINFGSVFVWRKVGEGHTHFLVGMDEVVGKVVALDNVLVLMPSNVLLEA